MMELGNIRIEIENGIATLILNRPERLNALDKNLESLRLEVQHAAAFLSALRAVERPVLPSWFLDAVRVAIRGTGPLRL